MNPAGRAAEAASSGEGPFQAGSIVLVTLGNPREKFWGAMLALSVSGLTMRGIELESFEDSAAMLKAGDPFTPTTVFFPMHRVERVELDEPSGDIRSLRQRFKEKSGRDPGALFGNSGGAER